MVGRDGNSEGGNWRSKQGQRVGNVLAGQAEFSGERWGVWQYSTLKNALVIKSTLLGKTYQRIGRNVLVKRV